MTKDYDESFVAFTHDAQVPVLFLTPLGDLGPVRQYVDQSSSAEIPPALWEVQRVGHNNVTEEERQSALRNLVVLAETGVSSPNQP